jgi:hypothetical protein
VVGPCGMCGAFHYASHASTSSPWMGVCLLRCVGNGMTLLIKSQPYGYCIFTWKVWVTTGRRQEDITDAPLSVRRFRPGG